MDTTVVHRRSEKMENNSIGGRMDTLVVALGWWISRMMHCRECGNIEEYDGKIVSLQKNMVVKRNNCGRMGQWITQLWWKWGLRDFNSEDNSSNFYGTRIESEAENFIQHCNSVTVSTLLESWSSNRNMMVWSCIIWHQIICSNVEWKFCSASSVKCAYDCAWRWVLFPFPSEDPLPSELLLGWCITNNPLLSWTIGSVKISKLILSPYNQYYSSQPEKLLRFSRVAAP